MTTKIESGIEEEKINIKKWASFSYGKQHDSIMIEDEHNQHIFALKSQAPALCDAIMKEATGKSMSERVKELLKDYNEYGDLEETVFKIKEAFKEWIKWTANTKEPKNAK